MSAYHKGQVRDRSESPQRRNDVFVEDFDHIHTPTHDSTPSQRPISQTRYLVANKRAVPIPSLSRRRQDRQDYRGRPNEPDNDDSSSNSET